MKTAKIISINQNTGSIEVEAESGGGIFRLNLFGLQDGHQTYSTMFRLKPGMTVYFDEDGARDKDGTIKRFYTSAPEEYVKNMVQALKEKYGKRRDYPLIGDYVIDENGKSHRITIIDGDMVQFHSGSYFFGWDDKNLDVYVSHSGSCGYPEPIEQLEDTGHYDSATFWTFKDFSVRAHNGQDFEAKVKVWKFVGKRGRGDW